MLSSYLVALAVAGTVNAVTPAGFEPSSTGSLFVAYNNKATVDGVLVPRAETASNPVIGTKEKLFGTYALIMVDPDIPGAPADGKTGQFLHWMQTDLSSAASATTVGGQQIFVLSNTTAPVAVYAQPSPPNRAPVSHRYVELLVNTTGNTAAVASLKTAGASRGNFSALNVINAAGAKVVFGNSFNVTNEQALSGTPATSSGSATARASSSGTLNGGASTVRASSTSRATVSASRTSSAGSASGTGVRGNATQTGRPISTGAASSVTRDGGATVFAGLVALGATFLFL